MRLDAVRSSERPPPVRRPSVVGREEKPIIVVDPATVMASQGGRNATFLAPVLPAGSIMLLHGPRGIGLSHVMVGCAVALANGSSFLGWRAPRPARVLLMAGNLPTPALANRLAIALASDRRNGDLPETLRIATRDGYSGFLPDLTSQDGQLALTRECAGSDVVMIDDLGSFLWGDGAELSQRIPSLAGLLGLIRARGRSVVVAQHSASRGSSRSDRLALREIEGIADVVIGLHRPAGYHVSQGARFELRVERAAHLSGGERSARVMQLVSQANGSLAWSEEQADDVRKQAMFDLLENGIEVRAAGRELGVSQATAYRWRKQWQGRNVTGADAMAVRT